MTSIKEVFENKLKVDSKTKSIDSLFNNDDNLNNTNYKPSYQRNYVWDDEKATYFIESILLGTEIPPLIYFKKISKSEVIDGRQRYQTILRYINNEFKLKRSGLRKLTTKDFIGKNFDSLDKKYKDLIWETKIRLIEFSFNTKEGITPLIEESLKKEIFKRYNSGITPLKTNEIDKAEYLYDNVNQFFKSEVINDTRILESLKLLFHFERFNEEVLLKKIRELLVIENIPIKYFSVKKSTIIDQFYEYLYEDVDSIDLTELRNTFISKLNILENIYDKIQKKDEYNRLISECLFWALSIFYNEFKHLKISNNDISSIAKYIDINIENYIMDRSSFAIHIKNRYENVSKIFKKLFGINFNIYLKDSKVFDNQIVDISNSLDNTEVIRFDDLRINKPEPSSISVDDIVRLMKRQKFIIRPEYQRNEVIDKKKASSIIESILLGIKIPPIFVYKNLDGVSEVIDGQQRILTILGFLGKDFINTDNEYEKTKKEYYSLSLKNSILSDLTSKKFEDLALEYQEKIKNYDLWVVEIDAKYNEKFDPVDLFIRLNYKPYPIKIDSFEMWNSYISRDLIDNIKSIYKNNKDWFYFRKTTTRMENENILTALIYLYNQFINLSEGQKSYASLDYYKIGNKINFRLKSKPDLTRALEIESEKFVLVSNLFEADFIKKLKLLITFVNQKNNALSLDYLLCVENGRRTQQSLYALWYFINEIEINDISLNHNTVISGIRGLFTQMDNVTGIGEFNNSVKSFKTTLKNKLSLKRLIFRLNIEDIANISPGLSKDYALITSKKDNSNSFIKNFENYSSKIKLDKFFISSTEEAKKDLRKVFEVDKLIIKNWSLLENYEILFDNDNSYADENFLILNIKRAGFSYEYIYLYLSSKAVFELTYQMNLKKSLKSILQKIEIPVLESKHQNLFNLFYNLIIKEEDLNKRLYFINVIDNIVRFLILSPSYQKENFDLIEILEYINDILSSHDSEQVYLILSDKDSLVSSLILNMNYLFSEDEKGY